VHPGFLGNGGGGGQRLIPSSYVNEAVYADYARDSLDRLAEFFGEVLGSAPAKPDGEQA
jgi:hypothetical protein